MEQPFSANTTVSYPRRRTAEERNAQSDKEEYQSKTAIIIQAFVRGSLDRTKVNNMLANLIEELLAQQASQQETPSVYPEDLWDEVQSLKLSKGGKSQKNDKPVEIQVDKVRLLLGRQ